MLIERQEDSSLRLELACLNADLYVSAQALKQAQADLEESDVRLLQQEVRFHI